MFDRSALASQLSELPVQHCIAFAASCCERQLPNYHAFSLMEHWGDIRALRQCVDALWESAAREQPDFSLIQRLIPLCMRATPYLDDFVLSICTCIAARPNGGREWST
jgi:uncharacterized protein YjaG (DUF416 family)